MESEMKFNLKQRLRTGAKNVPPMKHLAAILFFMSFIYCKTTSNPLISKLASILVINYHSLCYLCEIVSHFDFILLKILL